MTDPRKYTTKILDLVDEGLISWDVVATECLHWMSEHEVKKMFQDSHYLSSHDTDNEEEE